MLQLLTTPPSALEVLCIGAHSDDIEIGCAGALLTLVERGHRLKVTWVVLSASGERATEAARSAQAMLAGKAELTLGISAFTDSHFPAEFTQLKSALNAVQRTCNPDLIFTHRIDDRHQDHRVVGELTWQTWRDHLVLEYEIPKYEGDLGQPNFFVALPATIAARKIEHLQEQFASQRSKDWFDSATFSGLMRLRGVECRAESGFAEGFTVRKAVL